MRGPIVLVGRCKADRAKLMARLVENSREKKWCPLQWTSLLLHNEGCAYSQNKTTES